VDGNSTNFLGRRWMFRQGIGMLFQLYRCIKSVDTMVDIMQFYIWRVCLLRGPCGDCVGCVETWRFEAPKTQK
jgi:hypothetical protein